MASVIGPESPIRSLGNLAKNARGQKRTPVRGAKSRGRGRGGRY